MKNILNKPICVDDFGDEVYQCHYSRIYTPVSKAVFIGPMVPSITGTYVCNENARTFYQQERKYFDESEANCNTCKELKRVQHPKNKAGLLRGICMKGEQQGEFAFHPEDCMLQPCWTNRQDN